MFSFLLLEMDKASWLYSYIVPEDSFEDNLTGTTFQDSFNPLKTKKAENKNFCFLPLERRFGLALRCCALQRCAAAAGMVVD